MVRWGIMEIKKSPKKKWRGIVGNRWLMWHNRRLAKFKKGEDRFEQE